MKRAVNRNSVLFLSFCLIIFSCNRNNVKVDNSLKKIFDENNVNGCFALLNNANGKITVYNLARYRDSAYLPASTFKIVNSLIGLQTGIISSDSMVIKWDGIERPIKEWNKDLTMYEAFRVSAVPYYQEVARRIGKDSLERWMDVIGYGGGKTDTVYRINTKIDSFWLDNSLKITPAEQQGLVKMLYFRQLPLFFKTYQDVVKRAMTWEQNTEYTLAYKTGWGRTESGNHLGWIVGWIEEEGHPYFFVLNIESNKPDFDMVTVRKKMLIDILKQLGYLSSMK
jgi:beta-lactamase class D